MTPEVRQNYASHSPTLRDRNLGFFRAPKSQPNEAPPTLEMSPDETVVAMDHGEIDLVDTRKKPDNNIDVLIAQHNEEINQKRKGLLGQLKEQLHSVDPMSPEFQKVSAHIKRLESELSNGDQVQDERTVSKTIVVQRNGASLEQLPQATEADPELHKLYNELGNLEIKSHQLKKITDEEITSMNNSEQAAFIMNSHELSQRISGIKEKIAGHVADKNRESKIRTLSNGAVKMTDRPLHPEIVVSKNRTGFKEYTLRDATLEHGNQEIILSKIRTKQNRAGLLKEKMIYPELFPHEKDSQSALQKEYDILTQKEIPHYTKGYERLYGPVPEYTPKQSVQIKNFLASKKDSHSTSILQTPTTIEQNHDSGNNVITFKPQRLSAFKRISDIIKRALAA